MLILISVSFLIVQSCTKEFAGNPNEDPDGDPAGIPELKIQTVLTGYEIIWGMDFLPDSSLVFGEKGGSLYRKTDGTVAKISGFPKVLSAGQGGLLDIRVHPDYSDNGWIYATYSASNSSGGGELRLVRFRIVNNQVENLENLFTTNGSNTWNGHYGSRIVFDSTEHIYLSIGEGGPGTYGGPNTLNNNAQNLESSWGKIHRLKDDGSIPDDNPVFPGKSGPTSIYSYGNRNPQGLSVHPQTGEVWESEHGPRGGDELNIISRGANYGWPVYSIGINYDGTPISTGHNATGITEPVYTWTPSIGTCGIAFITSDKFKSWKGNLLVSGLASKELYMCEIKDNLIIKEEILLSNSSRVRNVAQAPDGSIYVSVENPGRLIRIIPE